MGRLKKAEANHMMPASKGSQHTSAHNIVQECKNNNNNNTNNNNINNINNINI